MIFMATIKVQCHRHQIHNQLGLGTVLSRKETGACIAAARVVIDLQPCDHVSPALQDLHWLPIKQRIEFKLCLLVHKSLIGHSPAYISDLLTSAADVPGRPALRTASLGDFIVPQTNRKFGDKAFCVRRRHSGAILRHFYSLLLTQLR